VLLGKYSLVVYLSHGLIYQGLLRLLAIGGVVAHASAATSIATYAATLVLSLAVALSIGRVERLRRLVTPRSLEDLAGGLRRSSRGLKRAYVTGPRGRAD
jgi:hypothetical protein